MTCGTHGALEMSFRVLCEPENSILLPKPCYTIYNCLASATSILPKFYSLLVHYVELGTFDKVQPSSLCCYVVVVV